jgi:hypothetical protein
MENTVKMQRKKVPKVIGLVIGWFIFLCLWDHRTAAGQRTWADHP